MKSHPTRPAPKQSQPSKRQTTNSGCPKLNGKQPARENGKGDRPRNPAEVLGLNPHRRFNDVPAPTSAPEAAEWLKHPVALVERVSLAMQLEKEPEYDPANPPKPGQYKPIEGTGSVIDWTTDMVLARVRLEQWAAERMALRAGRVANYTAPGRPPANPRTNRFDAALVRCVDFEKQFSRLAPDTQTILLLAYRERQNRRVICQITNLSERAVWYKLPAALAQLAALLDRANLL